MIRCLAIKKQKFLYIKTMFSAISTNASRARRDDSRDGLRSQEEVNKFLQVQNEKLKMRNDQLFQQLLRQQSTMQQ